MVMTKSLNCKQAAALILLNCLCAKLVMSFTIRLEEAKTRRLQPPSEISRAQLNDAEYAAILVAPLLYFHLTLPGQEALEPSWMATLCGIGQIGYFWMRVILHWPSPVLAFCAMMRYAGMAIMCKTLYEEAFGSLW